MSHNLDVSERAVPKNFHGVALKKLGEEDPFMVARSADYLCLAFQCHDCQSQNKRGGDPRPENVNDKAFSCMVIWATLDAFRDH